MVLIFGLELWHTCAGPLRCLPAVNSLVLYWPQGYLEHVSLHSTLFKSIMAFRSIKKNSSVCSVQVVNSTLQASVQPLMLAYDLPPTFVSACRCHPLGAHTGFSVHYCEYYGCVKVEGIPHMCVIWEVHPATDSVCPNGHHTSSWGM